jgi:hypothetical protein
MIWYTKNELHKAFLALVEEKQPLIWVCCAGKSSTLGVFRLGTPHRPALDSGAYAVHLYLAGTCGQQNLLASLQKRAGKLRRVLDDYN